MRVRKIKPVARFKPNVLAAMLVVSGIIAGISAWATGLNFFALAAILVGALLVNGLVATVEDKDVSSKQERKD